MVAKTSNWNLVIEEYDKLNDIHIKSDVLNDYLKNNESIVFYAFILHDNDIEEDGSTKRKHYHLVIHLNNPYSKTTILNDIASKLFINKECISARVCKDIVLSTQYLIHMNDKDKYQYQVLEIWTNDTNEEFKMLYDSVSSYDIDIDYLIELVNKSHDLSTIYKELGLKRARTYRGIIMDLWKDKYYEV